MRASSLVLVLIASALAADDQAVLVAKHASCFVHALPAWPEGRDFVRPVAPGLVLLRTARETGEMSKLVDATGTVSVPTRRLSYQVTRLLGVAADAERLYVLLWFSGRIFDRSPEAGAALEGGRYQMRVFWLGDGAELQSPSLGPDGLPTIVPPETAGAGPLKLVSGGVSCFGTTARYDGRTPRGW